MHTVDLSALTATGTYRLTQNVHGWLEADPEKPEEVCVEATVDATQVYTDQPQRDAHLRSAEFFDVEHHPTWTFVGSRIHQVSGTEFEVTGVLTVCGVTRPVTFDLTYLEPWDTLGGAEPRAQAVRRLRHHDAYRSA
ncbi:YceI family protein [Streptomyces sp. NPDC090741]|uniref:YceI family protein n=1 Tax=Streptomyces sp. NPDC090741 TaxID=3365967 RepID=UPI0038240B5A